MIKLQSLSPQRIGTATGKLIWNRVVGRSFSLVTSNQWKIHDSKQAVSANHSTAAAYDLPQQQQVYHISYPLDDRLFLFVGHNNKNDINGNANQLLEKSVRKILSPTQSIDQSALLLDSLHPEKEIEAIADMKHDDIMTRCVVEVEKQYHLEETKAQTVGGMGESDGGVWFVPYPYSNDSSAFVKSVEPLFHWELIRGKILVQCVPFFLCCALQASPNLRLLHLNSKYAIYADTIAVVKKRRHGIPFGVYTSGLVDASLASKLKDGIGLKR